MNWVRGKRVLRARFLWLSIFIFLLFVFRLQAVPINPHIISLVQPNGFQFNAKILGDESVVYYELPSGFSIVQDKKNHFWCVAQIGSDGRLRASPFIISRNLNKNLLPFKRHLRNKRNFPSEVANAPFRLKFLKKRQKLFPSKLLFLKKWIGEYHLAVLLIEFPDIPHHFPYSDFDNLLFSKNFVYQSPVEGEPAHGSLYDYYYENSNGKLHVAGTVFDWVQADSSKSYYLNKGNLIDEAIQKSGVDLNNFDGVAVIYAGNVGQAGSNLWPETKFSGLEKPAYMMSEQWLPQYKFSPIGIHCHEFGHLLGLPDLYDIDFSSNGIGLWGLMGYGCYGNGHLERPFHLCAWAKQRLGWVSETRIYSPSPQMFTLSPVEQTAEVAKAISGVSYFLLENRQNVGFDLYLPQHGLLIWHVDDRYGQQNIDEHRIVDLIEADNQESWGLAGDPFPGDQEKREFTPNSMPASIDYDQIGYLSVLSINETEQNVSFSAWVDLSSEKRVYLSSLDFYFPSLFTALEMSVPYDSIYLNAAQFQESQLHVEYPIIIQGESSQDVCVDGKGATTILFIANSDSVRLSNIHMTNAQNGISIIHSKNTQLDHLILDSFENDAIESFSSSPFVLNNTIVNNQGSGIFCAGGSPNVMNNIIVNNNFGINAFRSEPNLFYNDVWGNLEDYSEADSGFGDISKSPLFSDPFFGDYSLLPASPCIDAGNPAPEYSDPDGTRNDMGALYFHSWSDSLYTHIALNAGGNHWVDSTGIAWLGDRPFDGAFGFEGGTAFHLPDSLANIFARDTLYLTSRMAPESYKMRLKNGYYQISLFFVEPVFHDSLRRVFSVKANADTIVSCLDIFRQAGFLHPVVKTSYVEVRDEFLALDFIPEVGNPIISAIMVRKIDSGFRNFSVESRLNKIQNLASMNWGDYDRDSAIDVFLSCSQKTNMLFKNNGVGLFRLVNSEVHFSFRKGGRTSAFIDYDNDGVPDLFFADSDGNLSVFHSVNGVYVEIGRSLGFVQISDVRYIQPIDYNNDGFFDVLLGSSHHLMLFRNIDGHSFQDVSDLLGMGTPLNLSGLLVADFNEDGWEDIFVTNFDLFYPKSNVLFSNQNGQSFTLTYLGQNGQCADFCDFDHDGNLDLFVVSSQETRSRVFENSPTGWKDATQNVSLFNDQKGYHSILCADWNGDGWTDIILAPNRGSSRFFLNQNGISFRDASDSLGLATEDNSEVKSLSFADIDRNGTLDLAQLMETGKCKIYKNTMGQYHWIGLRLIGKDKKWRCLGAKVRIVSGQMVQLKECALKNSGASHSSSELYFGLGVYDAIDTLMILWPDGHEDTYFSVRDVDRYLTVIENVPLAVSTVELRATLVPGKGVRLEWNTLPEMQVSRLIVQKSYDQIKWTPLVSLEPGHRQSWFDESLDTGKIVFYRLEYVTILGQTFFSKLAVIQSRCPRQFKLFQNYPNPFNQNTAILYQIAEKEKVEVRIFNSRGQMVVSLVNKIQDPGFYTILWDGKKRNGAIAASGIYIIQMTQNGRSQSIKTILLK